MKKSMNKLQLKKEVVTKLKMNKVKGGNPQYSNCCPTVGALNSCPPPGHYCL